MLGARLTAAAGGMMNCTLGVLYLMPEQLVRRPLQPGQVSAVVLIESVGPSWTILFVASGLALLVAANRRRGFVAAHNASVFVWLFYGGAVLFSAILTEPPVPIVTGTLAGFIALMHACIARGCAERGLR
ncbi:hypothetical protein [Rhodococcus sp. LW-XY12]|uniref:hypothetical protein n=1 Tax=Rhodococcus sp. LW-XY12 TaxID=2856851 RepID=UPI001C58FD66|nr:hypothetical protein [Rhodococcus sp. LW-XY12]QXU53605.1 hypothetical protein KXC42_23245 [Rhodococcus sp. LW-XY12]